MKKTLAIALALLITMMAIPAAAVYATAPPSGYATYGTMQIEYRFAEGQTPNIPQQIERFGFTYYLVSQTEPVLERTLPTTRSYSYRVNGVLSQEELDKIQGLGNVTMEAVNVVLEREVDVIYEEGGLPTNDVEAIPLFKDFEVTSGYAASGYEIKTLERTGVTFELGGISDGLPTSFDVTVVYRGVESYLAHGYYIAESIFNTSEDVDELDIYIIIADYETDQMPPPIEEIMLAADGGGGGDSGLTTIEDGMVALQGGNPISDIMNGLVPVGSILVKGFWSFLSMIFSIAGVVLAALFAIGFFVNRKKDMDEEEEKTVKTRGLILRVMTIGFGLIVLFTWLLWDNFSFGMVWINEYTLLIGVLLAIAVGLAVITKVRGKRALVE